MWFKDLFKENKKEKEYIEMNKKSLYEEALEKCKNNEEMWVKVKDYEDYEISNLGNCRRLKSDGTYKSVGYLDKHENRIKLQYNKNGKVKMTTLAQAVAKNFELPNLHNWKFVKCIDRNTMNCRLDNLKYTTNVERYDKNAEKKEIEYSDKERIDNEIAKKNSWLPIPEQVEIWKDVVGYERWYEVSNHGNVRRIERDGTTTLLKATYKDGRARSVGLKTTGSTKTYNIKYLVAQAFNIKPTEENSRIIYNIDGDLSNDYASNLTYDYKQTEEYIKEQERIRQEQEQLERNSHKEELVKYIEENKEFLKQAKEINKEITIKDVYDKLCEILEVLKNAD